MWTTGSIKMENGVATVTLPSEICTNTCEELLKLAYSSTRRNSVRKVLFDFTYVSWCNIFEIGLIVLWLLELQDMGKTIEVIRVKNSDVHQFFRNYRFYKLLEDRFGIVMGRDKDGHRAEIPAYLPFRPVMPLLFFSHEQFEDILKDLYQGERYDTTLRGIFEWGVVKDYQIKDTVIKELGQNIFDHGRGSNPYMIITKIDSSIPQSNRAPDWEARFFNKLRGGPYLEITVGDKGLGIMSTLHKAYERDKTVPEGLKKQDPTEYDILQYAFWLDASSKNPEDRYREIFRYLLSGDQDDIPPPTGLYSVMEIVKRYSGFLSVRSGASIICFDCFDIKKQKPIMTTNQESKNRMLRRLTPFGGTQYKLYFPLLQPKVRQRAAIFFIGYPEQRILFRQIFLEKFFQYGTLTDIRQQSEKLLDLLREIEFQKRHLDMERAKLTVNDRGTIILNCDGVDSSISSKSLHFLLIQIMWRQEDHISIVMANVSTPLMTAIEEISDALMSRNKRTSAQNEKPFLLFDENLEARILGLPEHEERLFYSIAEQLPISFKEGNPPEELRRFMANNPNLFAYDHYTHRYYLIPSCAQVGEVLIESSKNAAANFIMQPKNSIFHPDKKVLNMSNRVYSLGFFEVVHVTESVYCKRQVQRWINYWIRRLKPSLIITAGNVFLKELLEPLLDQRELLHMRVPAHVSQFYKIALQKAGKKSLIVTDVLGTGRTIKKILEQAQHLTVQKVLAVVDAKHSPSLEHKGITYDVECVVRHPLTFYPDSRPHSWAYDEIYLVDRQTNTLLKRQVEPKGPMWTRFKISEVIGKSGERLDTASNEFFDSILVKANAVVFGHFDSVKTHILYLFLIPHIADSFAIQIAEKIRTHVQATLPKIDKSELAKKITHILYPDYNPGVREIARGISTEFMGSRLVPIHREEILNTSYEHERDWKDMQSVIVFDDSLSTSETLQRIIDIAERAGAKIIFAYALIKRGSSYGARLLEKRTTWGTAGFQFRYLAEAEIPMFQPHKCPICQHVGKLRELFASLPQDEALLEFRTFIKREIRRLSARPISMLFRENLLIPYLATAPTERVEQSMLRWKLELAKTKIGIRKEIAGIVKEYENNPQEVLTLLKVMARESYAISTDTSFSDVFYPNLRKAIISACLFFLREDSLDYLPEDLDSVLTVLKLFAEDLFIDRLPRIFEIFGLRDLFFNLILMHVFISGRASEQPGRIVKTFSSLRKELPQHRSTLDWLVVHWKQQETKVGASMGTRRAQIFRELKSVFHELKSHFEHLEFLLHGNNFGKAIHLWRLIYGKLEEDTLPQIRILIGSGCSRDIRDLLWDEIISLEDLLGQTDRLILSIRKCTGKDFAEKLTRSVSEVNKILLDPMGIQDTLSSMLTTDIKKILLGVIQQQKRDMEEKNIEVVRDYPGNAAAAGIVFGEELDIAAMFSELIGNVYKYAFERVTHPRKLLVTIKPRKQGKLDVYVLDNGIGIGQNWGTGLEGVRKKTERLGGTFKASNTRKGDGFYPIYSTKAVVTLQFLPIRLHND